MLIFHILPFVSIAKVLDLLIRGTVNVVVALVLTETTVCLCVCVCVRFCESGVQKYINEVEAVFFFRMSLNMKRFQ